MAPVLGDAIVAAGGLDIRVVGRSAPYGRRGAQSQQGRLHFLYTAKLAPHIARPHRTAPLRPTSSPCWGERRSACSTRSWRRKASVCDAGHGVEGSTIVTAMRTDFASVSSGLGSQWFTAPAQVPDGLYFPGFSFSADANADIGDSTITETAGITAFAGRGAGHRHLRQRRASKDAVNDHGDVRDQLHRAQNRSPFRRWTSGHAHGHRPAQGGGDRYHAAHQHGHQAQGSRWAR
ncbi:MAG: DUF1116 domain-containing protein [Caldilineaceae bacterium]